MTLESGPKNLEGGKIEAPRVSQEMLGAEAHDDVARDDLQEVESDKEKGGAVKKKIEIPGIGEIEYTEKVIMFPEKIVQETGGVKGYIRKMVSWGELARFWNISESELEKIKTSGSCHPKQYLIEKNNFEKSNFNKTEGIKSILLALTSGEFINQTLNHVINRGGIHHPTKVSSKGDKVCTGVSKDKMLEKIRVELDKNFFDLESNKLDKEKKSKDLYIQSHVGFNLTNPGKLWSGYYFDKNKKYEANSPHLGHNILGLKLDTRNAVLRKYCSSILQLIKDQDNISTNPSDYGRDIDYRGYNKDTLRAILNPASFKNDNKVAEPAVAARERQEDGGHPYLPIVLNHPDIPELRWCHADYAAIPTKNGYNILEMIT